MTDAERIAEYIKRCGLSDGNWPDCARILQYAGDDFTDESCYGVVKHLATMLSDVRREERMLAEERCLDILTIVGIAAMEAGHTNVGKYIAAASTPIRSKS